MRILLSYSFYHFDPGNPKNERASHSAAILAKTLYDNLSNFGSVTYIDSGDYQKLAGQPFDLFIGIENNFFLILKTLKIKKSILWCVNMHPLERKIRLERYKLLNNIHGDVHSGRDKESIIPGLAATYFADYIICVGNIVTLNSYIKYGVNIDKIIPINYGVGKSEIKHAKRINRERTFVYSSSEIGLRKGFDIVYKLFSGEKIRDLDFKLHIIGSISNSYYKLLLDSFVKALGGKIVYHGWVDSSSKRYLKIIREADYLIFPSIEEGQAGTVLEGLREGLIPIITDSVGVDFSPLGNLEAKTNSNNNLKILLSAINLSDDRLLDLRNKSLQYYEKFHDNHNIRFNDLVRKIIKSQLYPKVNVIMPIYNKGDTIIGLLKRLDLACKYYKNIDVTFVFDGCYDDTEKKVRRFYQGKNNYGVKYYSTPNIFEIKSDNFALRRADGKYSVLVQDDNYIYDRNMFYEATIFLEKNNSVAVLGALAGVNFYPRGTKNLFGSGQIVNNDREVYWRQDNKTDPTLRFKFFEVDAAMRGPLFIRNNFLKLHGYLDEIYAPQYNDDMDLCFRARRFGYNVYAFLSNVKNISLSTNRYTKNKSRWMNRVILRSIEIFYHRWRPSREKNYTWIYRYEIISRNALIFTSELLIKSFKPILPLLLSIAIWYGKKT